MSILQTGKLRFRGVMRLVEGHEDHKGQSWDLKPDWSPPQPPLGLTVISQSTGYRYQSLRNKVQSKNHHQDDYPSPSHLMSQRAPPYLILFQASQQLCQRRRIIPIFQMRKLRLREVNCLFWAINSNQVSLPRTLL